MNNCNCSSFTCSMPADFLIQSICGHHPSCPHFSINRDTFLEEFNLQVNLSADAKAQSLLDKFSKKLEQKLPQLKQEKEITAPKINKRLFKYLENRYFPITSNSFFYEWESDLLAVNKQSLYITEYEVKISRSDFKADFKKESKHSLFSDAYLYKCNFDFIPNYFYYATTPGLLDKSIIPSYAGLIEVGVGIRIVKKAPILHQQKINTDQIAKLLTKMYYKYWNLI